MARAGPQAGSARRHAVARGRPERPGRRERELSAENVDILGLAALRGLFSASSDEAVTFVNAPQLAEQRGVSVEVEKHSEAQTHRSAVEVRAVAADGTVTTRRGRADRPAAGREDRHINGRSFDLRAEGHTSSSTTRTARAFSVSWAPCWAPSVSTSRPPR